MCTGTAAGAPRPPRETTKPCSQVGGGAGNRSESTETGSPRAAAGDTADGAVPRTATAASGEGPSSRLSALHHETLCRCSETPPRATAAFAPLLAPAALRAPPDLSQSGQSKHIDAGSQLLVGPQAPLQGFSTCPPWCSAPPQLEPPQPRSGAASRPCRQEEAAFAFADHGVKTLLITTSRQNTTSGETNPNWVQKCSSGAGLTCFIFFHLIVLSSQELGNRQAGSAMLSSCFKIISFPT